jgi:hypothetical protein
MHKALQRLSATYQIIQDGGWPNRSHGVSQNLGIGEVCLALRVSSGVVILQLHVRVVDDPQSPMWAAGPVDGNKNLP